MAVTLILPCTTGAAFCARFLIAVGKERKIVRSSCAQRLLVNADELFPKYCSSDGQFLRPA
jgi:hypothetical protein